MAPTPLPTSARPLGIDALPLYAAPFDAAHPVRVHFSSGPYRPTQRCYGAQAIARDLPWLDAVERWLLAYNRWHSTVATPVTRLNSTIASRVNRPAAEVDEALRARAAAGPVNVGAARLEFVDGDGSGGQRGRLTIPWAWPALDVVVGARPWSSGRCDLVLELGRARRLRIPRRWFPVAHAIVDELRRAC